MFETAPVFQDVSAGQILVGDWARAEGSAGRFKQLKLLEDHPQPEQADSTWTAQLHAWTIGMGLYTPHGLPAVHPLPGDGLDRLA